MEEPGLLGSCVERNTTIEENEAQEEFDEESDQNGGSNDRTSNRIESVKNSQISKPMSPQPKTEYLSLQKCRQNNLSSD